MITFRIIATFVFGIILAELESIVLPIVLVVLSFLGWLFLKKHAEKALLVGVVAAGCLLALVDKAGDGIAVPKEEKESPKLEFLADKLHALPISQEARGLAFGMLLGNKDFMSKQQTQSLRNAGLSHIVAVSGLHVGIIYALLMFLFFPLRLLSNYALCRLQGPVCVVGIWLYVYAIGCPVSGIRAAAMISIFEFNLFFGRYNEPLVILASSALLMLLYNTQFLWNASFQLSFLATFGVLQSVSSRMRENPLVRLARVSLFAQIMTAPIVAYYFHVVPVLAWVQGILVIPVLSVLLYSVLLYAAFPVLSWLDWPVESISGWIFFLSDKVAVLEHWCLGGGLQWFPSITEVCLLELAGVALCILLTPKRTEHTASRKYILPF